MTVTYTHHAHAKEQAAASGARLSSMWRAQNMARGHERSGRGQKTTTGPKTARLTPTSPCKGEVGAHAPGGGRAFARTPAIDSQAATTSSVMPRHTPGIHGRTPAVDAATKGRRDNPELPHTSTLARPAKP